NRDGAKSRVVLDHEAVTALALLGDGESDAVKEGVARGVLQLVDLRKVRNEHRVDTLANHHRWRVTEVLTDAATTEEVDATLEVLHREVALESLLEVNHS